MRDTLSVLARRAHDTEAAHLLRLRPGSIPLFDSPPTATVPPLNEFRERVDPDGVYNESELLALYEEDYPPGALPTLDRHAARNVRLRRCQAKALARMEARLAQDPRPDHSDRWMVRAGNGLPPSCRAASIDGELAPSRRWKRCESRRHWTAQKGRIAQIRRRVVFSIMMSAQSVRGWMRVRPANIPGGRIGARPSGFCCGRCWKSTNPCLRSIMATVANTSEHFS